MIIDDLPSISIANDSDEIAIEQGTATKKITKGNFLQEIVSSISSLISDISGKVNKSGDTMSGTLRITNNTSVSNTQINLTDGTDITATASSNVSGNSIYLTDKNGVRYGGIAARKLTDGKHGMWFFALRPDNGNSVGAEFYYDSNNNRSVVLTPPDAWRSALGLGEIVYGSNTSGNVSIPNGTATEFSSITLTTGVWVVVACADWEVNAVGYRQIATAAATNPNRANAITTVGLSGKEAYQQLTMIRPIAGASSNIVFFALQNSGAALKIYPCVYAVRVG